MIIEVENNRYTIPAILEANKALSSTITLFMIYIYKQVVTLNY